MENQPDLLEKKADISKQELAYQQIKAAIIRNELRADELLVERNFCASLGISRTPLREALRRLAVEGLVESIPDKGMFVTTLRFEDVVEIYDLRGVLEGLAAKLFTQRRTENKIKLLEECLEKQEQAYNDKEYNVSIDKDIEFHQIYVAGCENKRLINFEATIRDQLSRAAYSTASDHERIELSIEQHRSVLNAIKAGQADLAEKLVKDHILNVKEYHINHKYFSK